MPWSLLTLLIICAVSDIFCCSSDCTKTAYLLAWNWVNNHQTVPASCLQAVSCDGKQPIVFHMIFSSITFSILDCFICNCNMNAIFLQSWGRTATDRWTGAASVCRSVNSVAGSSDVSDTLTRNLVTAFSVVAYSSPWWQRQKAPLKPRWTSARLHDATTQKTAIFIFERIRDHSRNMFLVNREICLCIVPCVRCWNAREGVKDLPMVWCSAFDCPGRCCGVPLYR
jgi:hypothetical protein